MSYNSLHKSQSYILKCSSKIENLSGTALGMHVDYFDSDIFVIPGVPEEMKNMMKHTVLPWIYNKTNSKIYVNTIRTTGIMESSLAEKIGDIIQSSENTEIAFLPQFTGVDSPCSEYSRGVCGVCKMCFNLGCLFVDSYE